MNLKIEYKLTSGSGSLTQALGITTKFSGELLGKNIWIDDRELNIKDDQIKISPRLGVEYAKEYALLSCRFQIKDNPWSTK